MFHEFQSPSLRGSGRFPMRRPAASFSGSWFQSPSLRGSGRFWPWLLAAAIVGMVFQSPSLRGSGRFKGRSGCGGALAARFNPLHCGAVVASRKARGVPRCGPRWFQSPSLRGSGRFHWPGGHEHPPWTSFNPLHCGAVVASRVWALFAIEGCLFQSPSLRGSGRFYKQLDDACLRSLVFQSPSLRGSGRFLDVNRGPPKEVRCFNPLHCGAVVASRATDVRPSAQYLSQSPSLRGSGRFPPNGGRGTPGGKPSQSPSLRGSGRFQPALKPKRAPSRKS